jgi:hypothetical protein
MVASGATVGVLLMLTACGSATPAVNRPVSTTPTGHVTSSTPTAKSTDPGPNWQPAKATTAVQAEQGYLNAAKRGDCQTAERYVGGHPVNGGAAALEMPIPGDICLGNALAFNDWKSFEPPRTSKKGNEAEFAVQLHVTRADGCGNCHTGTMDFFLTFDRTPLGWLLENGGTGP